MMVQMFPETFLRATNAPRALCMSGQESLRLLLTPALEGGSQVGKLRSAGLGEPAQGHLFTPAPAPGTHDLIF